MIKTDCYLAVLKKYKEKYPDAHFEIITRTANHPLSPSWQLLEKIKEENLGWDDYTKIFLHEMKTKDITLELHRLKNIAREKDVYLVCYEKDANFCHRSLVKQMIDELDESR